MTEQSALRIGEFELLLTLAIEALGNGAHGAALAREIEGQTGRTVSLGAIYKTLGRLEDRGLLTAQLSQPTAERGGRRRKLYRLNAGARAAMQQSLADIDALRNRAGGGFAEGTS